MKRLKKLFKKLNNRGSSVVMVIVCVGFIAIIVGALLTSAAYAYRLKMVNRNAQDNFYYVEQAMQEIYAGVGSMTVENMYDAYTQTIENMVYYDITTSIYKTLDNDSANEMFKKRFIQIVKDNDYFKQSDDLIAESLQNFISNSTVKIDKSKLHLDNTDDSQIVISNITLNREVEYKNNSGSGSYTQTVSADIVISEPDFTVNFNSNVSDYSNLFNFALVGDMGVEIEQNNSTTLAISGNLYAASDYYNKKYNEEYTAADSESGDSETKKVRSFKYEFVTADGAKDSISYNLSQVNTATLQNRYAKDGTESAKYDGVNDNSRYSGLYIKDSKVSIQSDMVIVPGTIAVLNNSDLTIYSRSSSGTTNSEVWADNVVLGGSGTDDGSLSPEATFMSDLYVKDDTEINADGAKFTLRGSYYGYGDSTQKDSRTFVSTVDKTNFMIGSYDERGNVDFSDGYNRGHYNSSSIVINGQNSDVDLSNASVLYLAGRAYIELSGKTTYTTTKVDADGNVTDGDGTDVVTETYKYNPTSTSTDGSVSFIRDYKTGESVSLKTNQLAYIPITLSSETLNKDYTYKDDDGNLVKSVTCVQLTPSLAGSTFFSTFFPKSIFVDTNLKHYVPCIYQKVDGRGCYYYDFETAYKVIQYAKDNGTSAQKTEAETLLDEYKTVDSYSAAFIMAYTKELNDENSSISEYLTDISTNEDYTMGDLDGASDTAAVYSNGAITVKSGKTFDITTSNGTDDFKKLFTTASGDTSDYYNSSLNSTTFSNDLSKEYCYVKWNLGHFASKWDVQNPTDKTTVKNTYELSFVDELVADSDYGESVITPINRYLNVSAIENTKKTLDSGYLVWIDDGTSNNGLLTIKAEDGSSTVRGVIITKGDVTFDSSVKKFEGLIVAGGKIYIRGNLESIVASPEICRSVLKEAVLKSSDGTEKAVYENIKKIFKEYADVTVDSGSESTTTSTTTDINTISYSDVCSLNNWTKNVE